MKPSERLKEIENKWEPRRLILNQVEITWLIARVKKLTEALAEIEAKTSLFDLPLNDLCKKVLEE